MLSNDVNISCSSWVFFPINDSDREAKWICIYPALRIAQERELEEARGKLGAVLGAPLFVAGSGAALATAATTTATAVTGAAAEADVLIGYIGAQAIRYARTIGTGIAVGSGAASTYAVAETHSEAYKMTPEYEGLAQTMKFLNDPSQSS
ncbi:hypothetical protein [Xenorhabdus szentirmaii]|uniref:Uncharacterized protein n=1 Tax=Xenorhabdus szentirmaii DSM 16338 TaxID=1427518 RepID=W1ITY4_9GAMM|nr:hypothetical protein [Xenorhabdus szentirmaii]PHM30602.1 hypothetical protein Xsze_04193 [Xenorhabdus szentirmaii DSM 16338]CDL81081.1 hypothetical protein XSR1_100123 [Xenorhabdus szentirmaii DSM 16338]